MGRALELRPRWAGQFDSFNQWVNRASRYLTGTTDSNGWPMPAICVDTLGRRCHNGGDFMRARDEGTFPVRFFWEMELPGPCGCNACGSLQAVTGDPEAQSDHCEIGFT